ncbi:MAG: DUF2442 domain-containing protein [PVC group bacterium]
MNKTHKVGTIKFKDNTIVMLVDGKEYAIEISHVSPRLANASDDQRRNFVVSPSGYGIHWPDIDEDLSIDGILGIKHNAPVLNAAI